MQCIQSMHQSRWRHASGQPWTGAAAGLTELPFTPPVLQTIDYAPQLDAPAAALLTEEELAVCTTSHKPRQLAAFKMQHLLAEAEPHIPHPIVSKQSASCCMP